MLRTGFREYEEEKLRFPACCRQKNAIFYLIFTEPRAHHKVHPCTCRSLARSMAAKRGGEKRSGLGESDDGNEDGVQSGDKLSGQPAEGGLLPRGTKSSSLRRLRVRVVGTKNAFKKALCCRLHRRHFLPIPSQLCSAHQNHGSWVMGAVASSNSTYMSTSTPPGKPCFSLHRKKIFLPPCRTVLHFRMIVSGGRKSQIRSPFYRRPRTGGEKEVSSRDSRRRKQQ